ncbi:30S ribosomal protein S2 [Candidatus Wolfebacteria bacterium]|nr:30S ribosomal protein S2 [Candidatus Wolfebacteria bacterium]
MEEQVLDQEKIEKEDDLLPPNVSKEDLAILEEMMRAGMMYGHKKSKTNPKFRPYIYTTRNGLEIIDLAQTIPALESAAEFLKGKIKEGAVVLVAATQPAARDAVEALAKKFNFSFINERWIGGLLTNFKVISSRIEYFKKIKADFDAGRFEKYTKKERVMINRDIDRMKKMFTGLENLLKVPDVLVIIDPILKGHVTALREAKRLKIKTIAIVDSDDDPEAVDFPIPANDHSKASIDWIIEKISAYLEKINE